MQTQQCHRRVLPSRSSEPGGGTARACRSTARTAQRPRASSYAEIIDFYYPGTKLDSLPDGNTIRVWITADNDKSLARPSGRRPEGGRLRRSQRDPAHRHQVQQVAHQPLRLRSGCSPTATPRASTRRTRPSSSRAASGTSRTRKTGTVKLAMPNGDTKTYRGKLALRFSGSGARTVNYVSMETYLRGVVPAEMPASWSAEAVKAQAVAARTYAAKLRAGVSSGSIYDLCDTTSCQVYRGVAVETPGQRQGDQRHSEQGCRVQGQARADDVLLVQRRLVRLRWRRLPVPEGEEGSLRRREARPDLVGHAELVEDPEGLLQRRHPEVGADHRPRW